MLHITPEEARTALLMIVTIIDEEEWPDDDWITVSSTLDINLTKDVQFFNPHQPATPGAVYFYRAILYRVKDGQTDTSDQFTILHAASPQDWGRLTLQLPRNKRLGMASIIESHAEQLLNDDGADPEACANLANELAHYLEGHREGKYD